MPSKVVAVFQNKYFLSLSGNIIMSGLGMLNTAIICRSLSISDAGIWYYFVTVITLIDSMRSGFLTTAFIKFYAGSGSERAGDVAGSTWFIGISITGVLVLINIPLLFFQNHISDVGYKLIIQMFSACFICMLPQFIATCVVTAEQRFDKLLYIRLINVAGFSVYIILLIFFKRMNTTWVAFAYILSYFVASVFCLIKGWARLNTFRRRSRATILELYHFGKYSLGTSLSANLWGFSDIFMLKTLLDGSIGYSAVSIFNLGQSLMQAVEILLRSFAATALPALAALFNKGEEDGVIYTMKKYIGIITFMLVPIIVFGWVLADVPIYIIGGGKYLHSPAANVFRILILFSIIAPADRFFALTIDVINKPKINFYKLLAMLATNILFNYIGLLIFPNVYGVTVTTFAPILMGLIVGYITMNNWRKFSFWDIYVVGWRETKLALAGAKQKFFSKG